MSGDSTCPLAIDIGSSAVKLVQLGREGGRLFLSRLGAASLPPGAARGGFARNAGEVMRVVEELISAEGAEDKKVVVALSGAAAILRPALLPSEEDFPVADALEAEAAQTLPVPLDEVRLSHLRIGRLERPGGSMDEYLMIAARRRPLEALLDALRDADYEPVIVDVNFLAMESAFELSGMRREGETVALADVGASSTLVNVGRDAHTLMARAIPSGGAELTKSLANRLGVSEEEAEAVKRGEASPPDPQAAADVIREEVENLATELERTFRLMWRPSSGQYVDRVVLSGGGALLEGLPARLAEALDLPVEVIEPFRRVETAGERVEPRLAESLSPLAAIGAGLAYRAAESA